MTVDALRDAQAREEAAWNRCRSVLTHGGTDEQRAFAVKTYVAAVNQLVRIEWLLNPPPPEKRTTVPA